MNKEPKKIQDIIDELNKDGGEKFQKQIENGFKYKNKEYPFFGGEESLLNMGELYLKTGSTCKAVESFEMAAKEGSVEAIVKLGDLYKKENNYNEMKKYYEMAIKIGNSESLISMKTYYKDRFNFVVIKDCAVFYVWLHRVHLFYVIAFIGGLVLTQPIYLMLRGNY